MSVWTNISSFAREYSTHLVREYRSVSESFHRRMGSSIRASNRRSCSSSLTENQYLIRMMPSSTSSRSKIGRLLEEPVVLGRGAEPEDVLDAGAVVPTAVEQHDLAGRGELLHVPLEVPLRGLTLGRDGQRDVLGDAGVHVFRHPLDRAALARGVASLEHHHETHAGGRAPLLHLDELDLEPFELLLVELLRVLARPVRVVLAHGATLQEPAEVGHDLVRAEVGGHVLVGPQDQTGVQVDRRRRRRSTAVWSSTNTARAGGTSPSCSSVVR